MDKTTLSAPPKTVQETAQHSVTMLQTQPPKPFAGFVVKKTRSWFNRRSSKTAGSHNHNNPFFDEDLFRRMLVLERKRTERTKQSFLLALVDIAALRGQKREVRNIVGKVIGSLCSISRETDVKGWYSTGKTLGVIFLDCDTTDTDTIPKKVKKALEEQLSADVYSQLSISFFRFPDSGDSIATGSVDLTTTLYKSQADQTIAGHISSVCKRSIDVIGSIFGLLLFAPIFIVAPLIIKCTSTGPVFFTQKRVGRYGKTFTLFKFRTMKASNDNSIHKDFVKQFIKNSVEGVPAGQQQEFKMKDDPRVTKIGKFLRKTSLDELPQFINVLLGNMSLVGPRPAIPYEVDEYDIWHRRRVLEVKPGITGIWQVKGRSRTDFNGMVRMDINYIKTRSPVLDLRLIFTTPFALVSGKGAY